MIKNKKYLVFTFSVIFSIFWGYSLLANAFSKGDIVFPVAELNNCANKSECRAYCDDSANISACISFAEKYELMSTEEATRAKKFVQIGTGPGGCDSKASCENYCNDTDNIKTCIKFAEENDLISHKDIQEAKNVAKILREGRKLPGNCRGKTQCQAYCEDPDHSEECLAFGEEAGLMQPEELARAKKFIPLMKRGETPGGCKTKEQCEDYCTGDDQHVDECAEFALKIGAATKEEIEVFKKTKGHGPGGCRGRVECESFCNNPDNQEACFKFAEENGFMKKEDIQQIRGQMIKFKEELTKFPPEVLECLKSRAGNEIIEKINNGTFTPGPEIGRHIQACFENFKPQMEQMHQGMPEGQFMGPGGCKTKEECIQYCSDPAHTKECENIRPLPPVYKNTQSGQEQSVIPIQTYTSCPTGFYWNGKECADAQAECLARSGLWYPDSNTCAEKTVSTNCPEGQVNWQQSCWDPNSEKYKALICSEKGGNWSWEKHSCENYQSCPAGEVYDFGRCFNTESEDYKAAKCSQGGGVWISDKVLGSYCEKSTTTPQGYAPQKNKYMAAILQFLIRAFGSGY